MVPGWYASWGRKLKSYIIGPVPSRRLGKSLGIDLMPPKTCTYNCIYCQTMLDTSCKTLQRKEWVPLSEIIRQAKAKINCNPDIITITGCGEPTLYSKIGELIDILKGMTDTKISVLTNGSLLSMPNIRKELMNADIVMPNLDAGDNGTYQKVNRPHPGLSFAALVEGLISFRKIFQQQLWLEIFLLEGISTSDSQLEKIAGIAERISPDRIQLNTVTKPTREYCKGAVSREKMEQYSKWFGVKAEIIANYSKANNANDFPITYDELMNLLKKQHCTLDDISENFRLNRMEVIKLIEGLTSKENIKTCKIKGQMYYWI
jgi:wyosine [tRNA(Phe)-imidazoG37] synthetase (radical SAM superfamily)